MPWNIGQSVTITRKGRARCGVVIAVIPGKGYLLRYTTGGAWLVRMDADGIPSWFDLRGTKQYRDWGKRHGGRHDRRRREMADYQYRRSLVWG